MNDCIAGLALSAIAGRVRLWKLPMNAKNCWASVCPRPLCRSAWLNCWNPALRICQSGGFRENRGSHAHRWVIVANAKRNRQVFFWH